MANPITGSRYDEAATDAILKRRFGQNLPTGMDFQSEQPGPRYSSPTLATKATSSVPSKIASPSSFDAQMEAYRARQSAQPYKYGAGAEVLPVNPNAPKDKVTGIMVRGVDQTGTGNAQYPEAIRAWRRQTEDRAGDQQMLGGDQNSGYVAKAFSNVSGTPNVDVRRQGIAVANTNDVVNSIEQSQNANPYLRGSAPKTFADYEKQLASMKGDTTRAIAFKPGERRPVGMNLAQQKKYDYDVANKLADERANRAMASSEREAVSAKEGMIGKAETERQQAKDVAGIVAQGKVESSASTVAEEMKAIASALSNMTPEENPEAVKTLRARLAVLAGGGQGTAVGGSQPSVATGVSRRKAKDGSVWEYDASGKAIRKVS